MKTLKGSDRLRDAYPKMNDNFTKLDNEKVDKVAGKGLSENDFTDEKDAQLAQTAQKTQAIFATLAEEGEDWEVSE